MKKSLVFLLILLIAWLFIRFVLGGPEDDWICDEGQWVQHGNPRKLKPVGSCGAKKATGEEQLVGGDKDEHGCIGTAGYVWCEAKEKCLRQWEEPCADG